MLQRTYAGRIVNVMVATPAGGTGQGGIDRIMASLKRELERQARRDINARFLATRGNGHLAHSILYLSGFCFSMFIARMRKEVDVVHVNLASYGSTYRKLVIAICARMLGIPYILHLHGAEYMTFWSDEDTFLNRRIRSMFAQASGIVVLGTVWRDFLLRKVPEAEKRLAIVPNATEVPSLPHRGGGGAVHILFLGRIEPRKGVPELCEALAAMVDLPGWRATIAGDGEVEKLRLCLEELGLSGRVSVPGWQGPEDVARLLSQADVLTLPSHAENLPISVIEGMAAGLAVVATPVGAIEDIVSDGETGLLVPPGDAGSLQNALERLVRESDLRNRLGNAARAAHRLRLDVAPYADRLCDIWKATAETGKTRVES
ncbi:glycosyltransferase family 4 protein [Rhizobium puerariae]|uniref:Glycosyltransferase family 4 protein n=1 Tax=Rhizobium puerariae TaxID=1585791 RepID=A0ABV6AG40_9HYPH